MTMPDSFRLMPWDVAVFGLPCYEISPLSAEALAAARKRPGHYTARIDPLASKKELHENGFYYCDTLIEPYCTPERFVSHAHAAVTLSRTPSCESLLELCHGAFIHGRFHRDFNLDRRAADLRYDNWLRQFHDSGSVIAAFYECQLAAFFCVSENKLVLHAVARGLQGKGLSRYLWSALCMTLFESGHQEVSSSVSAANLAVVNLYASLGFGFRKAVDVYHLYVP